jgi:hypothetical protein
MHYFGISGLYYFWSFKLYTKSLFLNLKIALSTGNLTILLFWLLCLSKGLNENYHVCYQCQIDYSFTNLPLWQHVSVLPLHMNIKPSNSALSLLKSGMI